MRSNKVVRLGSLALVCTFLASCSDQGPAEPAPAATEVVAQSSTGPVLVVWPFGEPDDGGWADDEAVGVLRRSDLAIAVAYYTHDWSAQDLLETTSEREYGPKYEGDLSMAMSYAEGSTTEITAIKGPTPRVILDVEQRDGATIVVSCTTGAELGALADGFDPRAGDAVIVESALERENGNLKVVDSSAKATADADPTLGAARCDLSELRYGYFDPPRPAASRWLPEAVVGPDGMPAQSGSGSSGASG